MKLKINKLKKIKIKHIIIKKLRTKFDIINKQHDFFEFTIMKSVIYLK